MQTCEVGLRIYHDINIEQKKTYDPATQFSLHSHNLTHFRSNPKHNMQREMHSHVSSIYVHTKGILKIKNKNTFALILLLLVHYIFPFNSVPNKSDASDLKLYNFHREQTAYNNMEESTYALHK